MSYNNKNNASGFNPAGELVSWIVTVACLMFAPPLGIILLLRKLNSYAKRSNQKRAPEVSETRYTPAGSAAKTVKKKRGRDETVGRRSEKTIPLVLLLVAIALFIYGGENIYQAARDIAYFGADRYNLWDLAVGAFYCVGGLTSFTVRGLWQRRTRKFKLLHTLVGKRRAVPVSEIASAAGMSVKTARRLLQAMLDDGYFGEDAYIDAGLDSLVMSTEAADAARRASAPPEPEKAVPPENTYMSIIRELRDLNVTIIDEAISNKIDHIEHVTAQIFRTVEENPAKEPQIRRFMSYYLPTTLKLLRSYATLEKQGIQGENISGAKQNIGRILDTLATGFEQQLDQLFRSDVLDISSDISVLESMMKQDGLSDGGMMRMPEN